MDDDTDLYENGQEIGTNDGILLRKGPAFFLNEIKNSTTGTISLMHYLSNKLYIEWKPNDHYLIADADTQEQDDWSLVDTITKRQRTASECLFFNNNNNINNSGTFPSHKDHLSIERQQQQSPKNNKQKVFRVCITDLKHIDVSKNGHTIRLINKSDGKVHSEYFFQNGNADGFVRTLQTTYCLQRSRNNKNQYEIVDNIEYDKEKLQKTFAELKIDDIKGGRGGWKNGIVGQTMDFFAKISDVYTIIPVPGQSPQSSPTRLEPNNSVVSNNDDYELLSTSPRQSAHANAQVSNNEDEVSSKLPPRPDVMRGQPLSVKQWCEFMSEDGRISDVNRVKEIIFRGGIEPSLRNEVWKYLLNYFKWDHTAIERVQHRERKSQEYFQMKLQWLSMSQTQEKNFSEYRDRKCQIEKDVKRTDRTQEYFAGDDNPNLGLLQDILMTYVMYNFDLGYVQGMSDLLAPILITMNNQADAFWCFVGFMDMVFANFDMDQAGMKRQLLDLNKLVSLANPTFFNYLKDQGSENMFFCFRWLLVWFKREFNHDDILELWEVLWTGLPCINYHLLASVAILDKEGEIIMEQKYEFNEILKHVNELSLSIDLQSTLERAEAIYLQLKQTENLTDEIRLIIGEEPLVKDDKPDEDEYDDNFDDIITVARDPQEDEQIQRKIGEACERSMINSFY